jgi:hypothetical protein
MFDGKPEGNAPLERSMYGWNDVNRAYFKQLGWSNAGP